VSYLSSLETGEKPDMHNALVAESTMREFARASELVAKNAECGLSKIINRWIGDGDGMSVALGKEKWTPFHKVRYENLRVSTLINHSCYLVYSRVDCWMVHLKTVDRIVNGDRVVSNVYSIRSIITKEDDAYYVRKAGSEVIHAIVNISNERIPLKRSPQQHLGDAAAKIICGHEETKVFIPNNAKPLHVFISKIQ